MKTTLHWLGTILLLGVAMVVWLAAQVIFF